MLLFARGIRSGFWKETAGRSEAKLRRKPGTLSVGAFCAHQILYEVSVLKLIGWIRRKWAEISVLKLTGWKYSLAGIGFIAYGSFKIFTMVYFKMGQTPLTVVLLEVPTGLSAAHTLFIGGFIIAAPEKSKKYLEMWIRIMKAFWNFFWTSKTS